MVISGKKKHLFTHCERGTLMKKGEAGSKTSRHHLVQMTHAPKLTQKYHILVSNVVNLHFQLPATERGECNRQVLSGYLVG